LELVLQVSPVFTVKTLAARAERHPDTVTRALRQLEARGVLTEVWRGVWGATTHPHFTRLHAIPFVLEEPTAEDGGRSPWYLTGLDALGRHGYLAGITARETVTVAVQRHREAAVGPLGTLRFHTLQPDLVAGADRDPHIPALWVATPAKAIFDLLHVSTHRGRRYALLPELTLPTQRVADAEGLLVQLHEEVRGWIARVQSGPAQTALRQRWDDALNALEVRHLGGAGAVRLQRLRGAPCALDEASR
jgi:hypothetical protein